jgi:lipoprotein NlpI/transglutaminase-like putative cysteine protease
LIDEVLDGGNRLMRAIPWLPVCLCACALASAVQAAPKAAPAAPGASRQISKAGFSFLIEPVPSWVVPAAETPNVEVERAPMHYRIIDDQTRLTGAVRWSHTHFVRVLDEVGGLGTASQIEIQFDPKFQTLVLHHIFIVRDRKRIDKLDPGRVELLQRETQLERRMYDGRVTASIVLQDIRVGDQIDVDYSVRGDNPVFEGHFVDIAWAISDKGPVAQFQYRLLAPAARQIEYRVGSPSIAVQSKVSAEVRETIFRRTSIPQFHMDPGAPYIVVAADQIHFSEYQDWSEVRSWAQGLFVEPALDSPSLDETAATIRRVSDDPSERLLAALKFVQKDIRYFGAELGVNTHRPTAPDKVLAQRFGDCKDKVLLLIALLRRLDIPATPVLVSTSMRGRVGELLPSPLAFDHVIVRVDLKGSTYWLDGTRNHQTGTLAHRQSIGMGKGLWLGGGTAALTDLPQPYDELRMHVEDTIRIERFAEDPQLESRITYRGDLAEMVREMLATRPIGDVETQLDQPYLRIYPKIKTASPLQIEDSQDDDALTIVQKFTIPEFWQFSDNGGLAAKFGFWSVIDPLRFPPMQSRRQPLAIMMPGIFEHRIVVQFQEDVVPPGQKPQSFEDGDGSFEIHDTHDSTPRKFENESVLRLLADEVEADDWANHVAKLVKLDSRVGFLAAIPSIPLSQFESTKAQLTSLTTDIRSKKIKATTKIQMDSLVRIIVMSGALQGGRLSMPLRAQALTSRGVAYDNLGEPEKAAVDFAEALKISPVSKDTETGAAINALARNDPARAIELADRVLAADPKDFESLLIRAKAHFAAKQYPLAQQELQDLLKDRSAIRRGYPLILLYLTTRRMGSDGKDLLAQYPQSDLPREWPRPLIDWANGKLDADGALQSAKSGTPANERLCEAYFYLGEGYLADGDNRRAREYFQKSVDQGVTEFYEHEAARGELAAGAAR